MSANAMPLPSRHRLAASVITVGSHKAMKELETES